MKGADFECAFECADLDRSTGCKSARSKNAGSEVVPEENIFTIRHLVRPVYTMGNSRKTNLIGDDTSERNRVHGRNGLQLHVDSLTRGEMTKAFDAYCNRP